MQWANGKLVVVRILNFLRKIELYGIGDSLIIQNFIYNILLH